MRKADMFFMIQQVNKKREYLDAFIEELRAKGIDVKVGQMQYKKAAPAQEITCKAQGISSAAILPA